VIPRTLSPPETEICDVATRYRRGDAEATAKARVGGIAEADPTTRVVLPTCYQLQTPMKSEQLRVQHWSWALQAALVGGADLALCDWKRRREHPCGRLIAGEQPAEEPSIWPSQTFAAEA